MADQGLLTYIKEHKLSDILNPDETIPCEYFDEESFIKLNRNRQNCLNIFSLNIVSLPKHGGELLNFLNLLETNFKIIVLSEIVARNIPIMEHLIPGYSFHYVLPQGNNYGGVGIYLASSIDDISPIAISSTLLWVYIIILMVIEIISRQRSRLLYTILYEY